MNIPRFILFLLIVLWGLPVTAQQALQVSLKNGLQLSGKQITQTDESLILDTPDKGKVNVPLLDIAEIREISPRDFVFTNLNSHQSFIGPTAYGLPKGGFQYSNFMLFFHQLGYGLNDHVTLFGGMELTSVLASLTSGAFSGPGIYLRPHFSTPIQSDKLSFGAGVLTYGALGTDFSLFGAAPYMSFSLGSPDRNLSTNIGLAFGTDIDPTLVFSIAGNYRINNKFGLMTEHWVFPADFSSSGLVSSLGCRLIGKRTAWNLALAAIMFDFGLEVLPFPFVGFTYGIN
jgi:hypothetical protein